MDESKGWIAVAIFLTAFCAGVITGWFGTTMMDIDNFKISKYSTRQEIFSLPDGTTWKRIRTSEEVK